MTALAAEIGALTVLEYDDLRSAKLRNDRGCNRCPADSWLTDDRRIAIGNEEDIVQDKLVVDNVRHPLDIDDRAGFYPILASADAYYCVHSIPNLHFSPPPMPCRNDGENWLRKLSEKKS